ncbi:MAG: glutathione S-transferase [Gammaproteobacteria bacterium]|jgi:glutathione S-transferase
MKLLSTVNSPYGRVVRLVAGALGVELDVEIVRVRAQANTILGYSPTAKVPSLVLDDGTVIGESRLICEHLQMVSQQRCMSAVTDVNGRHWESLITGFMDGIAVWIREMRRPEHERSPAIIELERQRAMRCVAHLEKCWVHSDLTITFASATLASALTMLDLRVTTDWRVEHTQLVQWYDTLNNTALMRATAPPA